LFKKWSGIYALRKNEQEIYTMEIPKNIAFTTLIKTGRRFHEFNFTRKHMGSVAIYDIDVSDDRGERHYFSMRKSDGQWMIREQAVASWITDSSESFHEAIEREEQDVGA
jgi:hypothetical protein